MDRTIARIAEIVGGEPRGDVEAIPETLAPLDEAVPAAICPFLRSGLLERAPTMPLAVIAPENLVDSALGAGVRAAISHPEPVLGLGRLIDLYYPLGDSPAGFTHPSAVIDPGARVHPGAWIGPGAVVENGAEIGEGTRVGPNAVVCSGVTLGKYVVIGPCAVIGHEGFGFVPTDEGPVKIRQVGGVRVGDFAEIGAAACVDRATLGTTVVESGAKIDNLVQIGHNAKVGRGVLIAAQTGLAGSTRIGDGAMLGGQVGVADHREIGSGSMVAGQSGVTRDLADGAVVSGTPAIDRMRWLRSMARLLSESTRPAGNDTEDN